MSGNVVLLEATLDYETKAGKQRRHHFVIRRGRLAIYEDERAGRLGLAALSLLPLADCKVGSSKKTRKGWGAQLRLDFSSLQCARAAAGERHAKLTVRAARCWLGRGGGGCCCCCCCCCCCSSCCSSCRCSCRSLSCCCRSRCRHCRCCCRR